MSRPLARPAATLLVAVLTTAVVLTTASPALSSLAPETGPRGAELAAPALGERPAVDLLRRAADAGEALGYTGTRVVVRWADGGTHAWLDRVRHRAGDPVGGPDAAGLPDAGLAAAARGAGPVDLLVASYDVTVAGTVDVASRRAHELRVAARDGRLVARLWLDERTAMVLRRETYDETGRTTSLSAFLDVTVGPPARAAAAPPAWGGPHPGGVAALRRGGWVCPETLGDLVLYDARRVGAGPQAAMHLSYSDGLSTVSVFEQAGALDVERLSGYAEREVVGHTVHLRAGWPTRAVWQHGGHVLTVVADGGSEALARVVAAMPPDPPPPAEGEGLLDRMGAWLGAVNPFG